MKKSYIIPSVEVTTVKAESPLMSSPDGFSRSLGTNEVSGSAALGRERGSRTESADFDELW